MKHEPCFRISRSLESLLHRIDERGEMTVGECLEMLGSSGIAMAILLLALVNAIPIPSPPGFSMITGLPIIFFGAQLASRRETLWLPERFRRYKLRAGALTKNMLRVVPKLEKIERLLRLRWLTMSSSAMRRVIGFAVIFTGTLLSLPIPFANFPSGVALTVLSLGLIERDGVMICAGLALCLAALAVTLIAVLALSHGLSAIM